MNAIIEPTEIERYTNLVHEMMLSETSRECEFKPEWIRNRGWKVVPVEDSGHFSPGEIATLLRVLCRAGYRECVAVATQDVAPDGLPCYRVSLTEADLLSFNWECGPLRYLLTTEDRGWAISCNEWYNLFAGKPEMLEELLGQSVDDARQEFLEYASLLASGMNPDEHFLQVANHYASI